jgi:hypothetical protein
MTRVHSDTVVTMNNPTAGSFTWPAHWLCGLLQSPAWNPTLSPSTATLIPTPTPATPPSSLLHAQQSSLELVENLISRVFDMKRISYSVKANQYLALEWCGYTSPLTCTFTARSLVGAPWFSLLAKYNSSWSRGGWGGMGGTWARKGRREMSVCY